ncbi:unnamed protein product [Miscanthus lutarioriparius]|uniref:Uncharacterized protein n=1 Tax=Miscanthus lutarioriparius TaxID=422564 RepID=A0A811QUY2_9POAL|nr:unnamed protein product [Miscanthus lutarioriparius]
MPPLFACGTSNLRWGVSTRCTRASRISAPTTSRVQTKACKAMLLKPLNMAYGQCCQPYRFSKIIVFFSHNKSVPAYRTWNIDHTKPRAVYVCKDTSCCARDDFAFSSVPDTVCRCGKVMEYVGDRPDNGAKTEAAGSDYGVFVKGRQKFITTDDLQVGPASTSLMLSLCKKFGVQDPADLDKTILQLTAEKITSLLRRSLTSKQPLTGLHLNVPISPDDAGLGSVASNLCNEQVNEADDKVGHVKIKVLQTKTSSAVLYAEAGHDFVDLVFGLLSVPLGSVAKAFRQRLPKGCIDNLYRSIDGCAEGCKRAECKSLLLAPELSTFFGCGASQILQVNELVRATPAVALKTGLLLFIWVLRLLLEALFSRRLTRPKQLDPRRAQRATGKWPASRLVAVRSRGSRGAEVEAACCAAPEVEAQRHRDQLRCGEVEADEKGREQGAAAPTELNELDPKSPEGKSGHYSAYVKQEPKNFMVTDRLRVSPLSLDICLRVVSEAKILQKELV